MGAGMEGKHTAAEAAEDEDKAADARGLTPTEFGADDAQGPEDEAEEEAEEEAGKEDDDDEDDEDGDENEEEDLSALTRRADKKKHGHSHLQEGGTME